jgi:hypothetical protein
MEDKINKLIDDNAKENLFSILAWKMMDGVDVQGHWLKIIKNNDPSCANDKSIYEVDYRITDNQETVGYLDIEHKVSWRSVEWPYPKTNIAKYPMKHWQINKFSGRMTNKLNSFMEKPIMSFWVGISADYQRCQIAPALNIFNFGVSANQPTRYSNTPLPIYEVPNEMCFYCKDAKDFTDTITGWYKDVYTKN